MVNPASRLRVMRRGIDLCPLASFAAYDDSNARQNNVFNPVTFSIDGKRARRSPAMIEQDNFSAGPKSAARISTLRMFELPSRQSGAPGLQCSLGAHDWRVAAGET
jgi:hypothetical protein